MKYAVLIPSLLMLTSVLSGCATVEFYEREQLQSPLMQMSEDACLVHWNQKVRYSREGSTGGIGATAGGGCGCY